MSNTIHICYQFTVQLGKEEAFEHFYRSSLLAHLQQVPGFEQEILLRSHETVGQYMIIGRWTSFQLFAHWRNAPDHQLAVKELPSFLTSKPQINLYEAISFPWPA
jgi:heme-degrading monooxygenase HmoA